MKEYFDEQKRKFRLIHCYRILSSNPKWNTDAVSKSAQRRRNSPGTPVMVPGDEPASVVPDEAGHRDGTPGPSTRPPGRKQEKERAHPNKKDTGDVMTDLLKSRKEANLESKKRGRIMEEMLAENKKSNKIEQKKIKLERSNSLLKLMCIDPAAIADPARRRWMEAAQAQVIEKESFPFGGDEDEDEDEDKDKDDEDEESSNVQ
ncbi:hypothetical protein [Absidia glauca]|uniref:No apical meristem-associated C-terminal domain-containing protein n=1 Tax=Absidia glauca TaxID=4829 RepID=A0A163J9R7_ABSGL|nr:hypothetical protein [Absidia glauca]